ncbi:hypothetical protein [Enterobacter hormaechei]|nr:hypothetical protein [Enterobacter hormaechei]
MYEFNLVLLLLQQMCVFLVIAWLMSKNASVHSADAGHRPSAAQIPLLRRIFHILHYGDLVWSPY